MNEEDSTVRLGSAQELRSAILRTPPYDFTSIYLLDRDPHIFTSRRQFAEWRSHLAHGLDVDPLSIVIIGSSCLGYSLSPHKRFSAVREDSDIDVAVVSLEHFEMAWSWLRSRGLQDRITDARERNLTAWHRRRLVFDGTIATDQILDLLPFGPQWVSALDRCATIEPAAGRRITTRLYRNFASLREYHLNNVRSIREDLLAAEVLEMNPGGSLPVAEGEKSLVDEALMTTRPSREQ